MSFLALARKIKKLSERQLAERSAIARATLRAYEDDLSGAKIDTLEKIADALDLDVIVALTPKMPLDSSMSTVGISAAVLVDGFGSWKIHFFNFVDHFRKTMDIRLIMLPPLKQLDVKLQALLASIVCSLCCEFEMEAPDWALQEHFLEKPWFVAEMQSLKASALVESPLPFRRNNIFVNENFLQRA